MQLGTVFVQNTLFQRFESIRAKNSSNEIFIGEFGQRCSWELFSCETHFFHQLGSIRAKIFSNEIFIGEFGQRCSWELFCYLTTVFGRFGRENANLCFS